MQIWIKTTLTIMLLVNIGFMTGCASAYRCYDCRVNCKYCPRPAIPFSNYCDNTCHSIPAIEHLRTGTDTN